MAGSTGSRILWTGLLLPPILVLTAAAAASFWPERVVATMAAVRRAWSAETATVGQMPSRAQFEFVRVPPPFESPRPPVTLKGSIRTPDGEPFRGAYTLSVARARTGRLMAEHDFALTHGLYEQEFHDRPTFAVPLDFTPTYLAIVAEDRAPKVLGPYSLKGIPESDRSRRGRGRIAEETPAEDGDDAAPGPVDVALDPGFPFCVRVVDAGGEPILGAEVTARLIVDRASIRLPNPIRADDDGRAVFPAVSDALYEFEARVHGFRFPDDAVEARPTPNGAMTIALERGPVSGVALDEDDRPVADAVLLIAAEFDEAAGVMTTHLSDRILLARSGSDGRFRLPALHDESTYLIRAEGPDGSLGFAQGVRRGGGEVRMTLRPMRVVRAVASGSPALVTIKRSVPTGFHVEDLGEGDRDHVGSSRSFRTAPDGRFEYPAWGSVDTELVVDGRTTPVPWPPPEEPFPIDAPAATAAERSIRLQFLAEPAIRPIEGTMTLHLDSPPPERAHQDVARQVEIHDGQATFVASASESFRYDSDAVPGYWTAPGRIAPGGPGDRFVDVEILAAGSISGRVLNADGSPAGGGVMVWAPFDSDRLHDVVQFSPVIPTKEKEAALDAPLAATRSRRQATLGSAGPTDLNAETATTDADGRFKIPVFPARVHTRLRAERGRHFILGDEFQLAPGEERGDVAIRIPPKTGATVRIIDPEGRPVSGARLSLSLISFPFQQRVWPLGQTDADGLLVIDDLAEGETGYTLAATFDADFQPIAVHLTPGVLPLELKARRGAVLAGRVVEAVTGWPIPDLPLFARRPGAPDDLEVRTDADGRFRISTIPEGPVRLKDRLNLDWLSPASPVFQVGATGPVLLRVIDLRNEDPQPRPFPEF